MFDGGARNNPGIAGSGAVVYLEAQAEANEAATSWVGIGLGVGTLWWLRGRRPSIARSDHAADHVLAG